MKNILFISIVTILISSCANFDKAFTPACDPYIGMHEVEFLDCACKKPLLNPDGGTKLIFEMETAQGISKAYYCSRPGKNITANFTNGRLTTISKY